MSQLQKPNNQWAESLWIVHATLIEGCSMVTVLKNYDPFFYKFQTRLLEVEKEHPKLMLAKETRTYQNPINGKTKHYTHYRVACPKPYLVNLYNKINSEGFRGKTNKPEETSNAPKTQLQTI